MGKFAVSADTNVLRTIQTEFGEKPPSKLSLQEVHTGIDRGLDVAESVSGHRKQKVSVSEALALREWGLKTNSLPYVLGKLTLSKHVSDNVMRAAKTGKALRRRVISDSYAWNGKNAIKVAGFDADSTLRVSKSGSVSANGETDVRLLPFVAQKIRALVDEGYLVYIQSNQAGVDYNYVFMADADSALFYTVESVQRHGADVHYVDYAPKKDDFYKPGSKSFDLLERSLKTRFGTDVFIDKKKSFYVGDAAYKAGRTSKDGTYRPGELREDGRYGLDHSNGDRGLADNCNISFVPAAEYFGWDAFGVDRFDSSDQLDEFWTLFRERYVDEGARLIPVQNRTQIETYQTFEDNLTLYHQLDGKLNRSAIEGPQLAPGVPDAQHQHDAVENLAHRLSFEPWVQHVDSPDEGPARAEFRKQVAESRRAAVSERVEEKFMRVLDYIKDPKVRDWTAQAISAMPPEFFTEPSSSTGKHHPADEINPGGLALHTHRVVVMANWLCEFYNVSPKQRDLIIAACVLHDAQKGGWPKWDGYAKDHGPIGAAWLGRLWKTDDPDAARIRELVSNHLAQWNSPTSTPPTDVENQITSYADYLASLDEILVQTSKEDQAPITVSPAATSTRAQPSTAASQANNPLNLEGGTLTRTAAKQAIKQTFKASEAPAILPHRGCVDVPQVAAYIFDWDDNLVNMHASSIYVFHKETGQELAIPTDIYAHVKNGIGYAQGDAAQNASNLNPMNDVDLSYVDLHDPEQLSKINWSYFFHKAADRKAGSFRDFSDDADPGIFARHVAESLARPGGKGPVFEEMVLACENPETAQYVFVATARGHSRETMQAEFVRLQEQGVIKYVPPLENFYPCSNDEVLEELGVQGDPGSISSVKEAALVKLAEEILAIPLGNDAVAVLDKDGLAKAPAHLLGFSDDDGDNERGVQRGFAEAFKADPDKWKNIKVTTFGTGAQKGMHIIKSDGSLRDMLPTEVNEAWAAQRAAGARNS